LAREALKRAGHKEGGLKRWPWADGLRDRQIDSRRGIERQRGGRGLRVQLVLMAGDAMMGSRGEMHRCQAGAGQRGRGRHLGTDDRRQVYSEPLLSVQQVPLRWSNGGRAD
jgi:hypothetical protein